MNVLALAALALGRIGDIALAESTAAKAAARAPLDTILNAAELPSIRAAIRLQQHDPQAAILALEPVRPCDMCGALALAPAYYRGLAYRQAGHPDRAAAEYRRVVEHRTQVPDSPCIPMAALQLSRTLRQLGDSAGAVGAEREVAEAWRHADPDFRPLRHSPRGRLELSGISQIEK